MVADSLRVPHADHMLLRVPANVDPLRVAAASDNLADAWRAVVPALRERPGGSVLVTGGGAQSIGLYAAGLAVHNGASVVDYVDDRDARLEVAHAFGATAHQLTAKGRRSGLGNRSARYDVVVEASSQASGLRDAIRALKPGGTCTATGYYLATGTRVPIMDMYATSATLRVGISHVRPVLPELLDFIAATGFPAEQVTSLLADWDDAPTAYTAHTTKVVCTTPWSRHGVVA